MAKLNESQQRNVSNNLQAYVDALTKGIVPWNAKGKVDFLDLGSYLGQLKSAEQYINSVSQYQEVSNQIKSLQSAIDKFKGGNIPSNVDISKSIDLKTGGLNDGTLKQLQSIGFNVDNAKSTIDSGVKDLQKKVDDTAVHMAKNNVSAEFIGDYGMKQIARGIAAGNYIPAKSVEQLKKEYNPYIPPEDYKIPVYSNKATAADNASLSVGDLSQGANVFASSGNKENFIDVRPSEGKIIFPDGTEQTYNPETEKVDNFLKGTEWTATGRTEPQKKNINTSQPNEMAEQYTMIDPFQGTIKYPDGTIQKYDPKTQNPQQLISAKQSSATTSSPQTSSNTTSAVAGAAQQPYSSTGTRHKTKTELDAENKVKRDSINAKSTAATVNNTADIQSALAVLNKYMNQGIIDSGTYQFFKKAIELWDPDQEIDYANILNTFEQIKRDEVDPYFQEQAMIFGDEIQRSYKYLLENKALEDERTKGDTAKLKENMQSDLAARGLLFSGEAIKKLGAESTFAEAGTPQAAQSAIPVHFGGIPEGEFQQQVRTAVSSNDLRYQKSLEDLQRQAEMTLGSANSSGMIAGVSPIGNVTGSMVSQKKQAYGSALTGLYNQSLQNSQYGQYQKVFNE